MKKIWNMKKVLAAAFIISLSTTGMAFANGDKDTTSFDPQKSVNVVSREDGSGTRGAFIELFGIEVRGADGSRRDTTTKEAVIAKQTDVMMMNIAGDVYAIGYISLGSLNETVKAVAVNGVAATTANVKNGSYTVSRPFYIATKGEAAESALTKDFIGFILSAEGQSVIAKSYIPVNAAAVPYAGSKPAGKIVIAGSSSVTPVMEKLKEAYNALNPSAVIEIQMSDSSAGMTAALDGACDIGMSSRDLKDSELAHLTPVKIAIDGIAVIVNKNNPAANLTKDEIKAVFTGETTRWSQVIK
ncbi:MAG: substrate-binding domain-containing protein [Treponema sp.]|jgi:phosphate transport system substrate-binding protein|nr:substrate-binding domain-containing protein [Treponema sp.]